MIERIYMRAEQSRAERDKNSNGMSWGEEGDVMGRKITKSFFKARRSKQREMRKRTRLKAPLVSSISMYPLLIGRMIREIEPKQDHPSE
jgi:hypothetical protein